MPRPGSIRARRRRQPAGSACAHFKCVAPDDLARVLSDMPTYRELIGKWRGFTAGKRHHYCRGSRLERISGAPSSPMRYAGFANLNTMPCERTPTAIFYWLTGHHSSSPYLLSCSHRALISWRIHPESVDRHPAHRFDCVTAGSSPQIGEQVVIHGDTRGTYSG